MKEYHKSIFVDYKKQTGYGSTQWALCGLQKLSRIFEPFPLAMEAEQKNGVPRPLTVPLMHAETHHEPSAVEASSGVQKTTSTTSFFKTCFNGLNALSGCVLFLDNSCSEDFILYLKTYLFVVLDSYVFVVYFWVYVNLFLHSVCFLMLDKMYRQYSPYTRKWICRLQSNWVEVYWNYFFLYISTLPSSKK